MALSLIGNSCSGFLLIGARCWICCMPLYIVNVARVLVLFCCVPLNDLCVWCSSIVVFWLYFIIFWYYLGIINYLFICFYVCKWQISYVHLYYTISYYYLGYYVIQALLRYIMYMVINLINSLIYVWYWYTLLRLKFSNNTSHLIECLLRTMYDMQGFLQGTAGGGLSVTRSTDFLEIFKL